MDIILLIPEQLSWELLAFIFGEDVAISLRAESDAVDSWENEGGTCVG